MAASDEPWRRDSRSLGDEGLAHAWALTEGGRPRRLALTGAPPSVPSCAEGSLSYYEGGEDMVSGIEQRGSYLTKAGMLRYQHHVQFL